jgi:hypothetical protein
MIRSLRLLLAFSGLLLLSSKPSLAQEQIGLLETEVPSAAEFFLHGCLPVPPGTYRPDALTGASLSQRFPVVIQDSDGQWVVPQIEAVSRYPRPDQGAAVIELIARVTRPPSAATGSLVGYRVFSSDGLPLASLAPTYATNSAKSTWLSFDSSVAQILTLPGSLALRVRDGYGNFYGAKLTPAQVQGSQAAVREGRLTITKAGHQQLEMRYATHLMPVLGTGLGPVLPHHFGVHAYLGFHDRARFVTLDLRLHNAHSSVDPNEPLDDALGKLYFRELELLTPPGWKALRVHEDTHKLKSYPSGFFWQAHPLFDKALGDKLHVIAPQGQFHRRFVLVPPGTADQTLHAEQHGAAFGLAFCQPGVNSAGDRFWSWWNPATATYQTQASALPGFLDLGKSGVRSKLSADYAYLAEKLRTGTSGAPPLTSGVIGWMHPYGQAYGGISGGIDIHFFEGVPTAWASSRDGYRRSQIIHRMQSDRQSAVAFDADGQPVTLEEMLVPGPQGPIFPHKMYLTPLSGSDPFGHKAAPTTQANWVAAQGLAPAYEAELLSFEPIDMQHLVRYTRMAKALAWLGNDSLAKDDLCMQAAIVRLSYNPYANEPGGFTVPTNLKADIDFVAQHPGIGLDFNRGEGWMLDTMCSAYAIAPPAWRQRDRPWFRNVTRVVFEGQASCSGFIQANVNLKVLDGKYRTRQNYEEAIIQNGLWGMLQTVYAGTGEVEEALLTHTLVSNVKGMVSPAAWDEAKQAPLQQMAVGPLDLNQPLFCGPLPADGFAQGDWDTYQCWNSFAYAFRLSFDPLFLIHPALMLGTIEVKDALEASGLSNIENRAALLGLLQVNGQ